jgi:hypothetical protein
MNGGTARSTRFALGSRIAYVSATEGSAATRLQNTRSLDLVGPLKLDVSRTDIGNARLRTNAAAAGT